MNPTTLRRAARLAVNVCSAITAHNAGDYWIQNGTDAVNKGQPGPAGRAHCLRHVAGYTATHALAQPVLNRPGPRSTRSLANRAADQTTAFRSEVSTGKDETMWNTENTAQTVLNHVLAPSGDSEQCGGCEAAYSWDNARSVCPYHQGMMAGYDKALGDIAETAVAFQRDPDLVGMVVDRAQQLRIHDWQLMQRAENQPEPEGLSEHEKQMLNADVPADPRWAPAEQHVPHLIADVMHMGTVRHNGREIEQYKHIDTRKYLNLDQTGQAWEIAVDGDTGAVGARRIAADAAVAHLEGRDR